jgi:hypothetical protein
MLTNFSNTAASPTIEYSIQRDPSFYAVTPPDPIWGTDHALKAKTGLKKTASALMKAL